MAWTPIYMKNVDLILGDEATGTHFECQARSVQLTPEVNTTRVKTLCPTGQFANTDDPEWTLEITYLYGIDPLVAENALADYLLANQGTKVDFFVAFEAGGPGYTGTVTLIPGGMGGEQGNYSEQTVQLPVDGQPETWAGTGSS